ncbi:TerD family protein [Micromonospora sp. DT227]|uniref:TerD family protein n=1 Tax=Micromonospora sp. DT227 TaxID=3393433 RepID=UPI003CEE2392
MSTWWRPARRADLGLRDGDLPAAPFVVTNRRWYFLHRFLATAGARRVELMAGRDAYVSARLANQWGDAITVAGLDDWLQVGRFNGTAVVAAGIVHASRADQFADTCELTPLRDTPANQWLQAIGVQLSTTPTGLVISGEPKKENPMTVNLTKGGKVNLDKEAGGALTRVRVGLGWDVRKTDGPDYDLDASIIALNDAGVSIGREWFVYYGNLKSAGDAIVHQGDELTGASAGDDEQILIDVTKLPVEATDLRIAVTIYEAGKRGGQSFGVVENAFVRVIDESTGTELARFDLTEDADNGVNALIFGKLYRHNGAWNFRALGEGFANEIEGLVNAFKIA